jgi:glycine cleavage system H lipoate-binding protein
MISHPNLLTSHEVDAPTIDSEDEGPWIIDGIQTTAWHSYSTNHMWLEIDEEGICHIGIDSFLARIIGRVDKLTFAATSGNHHPSVVITVNGVDLSMVFPNRLNITAINSHLRADPDRIATDPYTFGWLFEGVETKTLGEAGVRHGLIHGKGARIWMQNETTRLSEIVHEKFAGTSEIENRLVADGGSFSGGLIKSLTKEQLLVLYEEFFFSHNPQGMKRE